MADEQPVDDMPDVSLLDNDIAPASDETPSEPAQEAAPGTDTQDAEKTEEQPSEGEQQPAQKEQKPVEDDEAARRAHNEQMARQRIQERQQQQRVKQAIAQQLDETYGPKTEQDLIAEGYSEQQAQIEALRQEMYYNQQRTQIAELNAGMQAEAVNIVNDYVVYNPNSPDYDPQFAQMVEQQYKIAARLQTDDNGIVTNAEVPLYDFYKQMADIRSHAASVGQQQGQQEYQQMLARTENPGGSSSTSASDSLEALEERLGGVSLI